MTIDADPRLKAVATLLQLEKEARHAETREAAGFVMVNLTRRLVPYRLAALWLARPTGGGAITAVSGIPHPEPEAPFMQWLGRLLAKVGGQETVALTSATIDGWLGEEWPNFAPPFALWLPLKEPARGTLLGGLWLARETEWAEADAVLAEQLADGYAETLARHLGRGTLRQHLGLLRRSWLWGGGAVAALIVGMVPVRLSVLAPSEIVPADPVVVAAPREGVVAEFSVSPNQEVASGQALFSLEDTEVRARRDIALKTLSVAEAEYHKAAQAAFGDRDSMAEKTILAARIDKVRAEASYAAETLEHSRVIAPRAGIAVFGDVNDWVGKPVRVGERIMTIADPAHVEIAIWLPVADAIVVEAGAEVRTFLNIAPLDPLPAVLRSASYEAMPTPDHVVAYRLKATLAPGTSPPRIGLKGTAKVYGKDVSLAWFVLRRPLAALRQMIGF